MPYWTTADIPDQQGRVAIVTGGNGGLGLEAAKALASRGARVILAVRDLNKGRQAARVIEAGARQGAVDLQECDLSSLCQIDAAAESLLDRCERIDLLINNAGVMFTPRELTANGFELQFGTNHLGHFALTGRLIERLLETPDSRVVTLSSIGHRMNAAIHFDNLHLARGYTPGAAYGQAKLANLMFTYELQRRLTAIGAQTIAVAAHPGITKTDLQRHMKGASGIINAIASLVYQRPAMGALPTLRAATDPGVLGGQYYGPDGFGELRGHPVVVTSSPQSYDAEQQRRLWQASEELTGVIFRLAHQAPAHKSHPRTLK